MSGAQSRTQTPRDYAHLLSSAASSGELPILIGGQAVNLFALLFLDQEPELKDFAPFAALRQQIRLIDQGQTTPRKCINLVEGLVTLISSKQAKAVAAKFGIDFTQALPIKEINGREEEQFRNFARKRLPELMPR